MHSYMYSYKKMRFCSMLTSRSGPPPEAVFLTSAVALVAWGLVNAHRSDPPFTEAMNDDNRVSHDCSPSHRDELYPKYEGNFFNAFNVGILDYFMLEDI